jgi:hypothetical protein
MTVIMIQFNAVLVNICASLTAQWPITKLAQNKYNTIRQYTHKQHTQNKKMLL